MQCDNPGSCGAWNWPQALRHLVRDVEQHIVASNPALRLLVGYLETLFALDEVTEPALAVVHIADLVASARNWDERAMRLCRE
jgi:hypothetical protein